MLQKRIPYLFRGKYTSYFLNAELEISLLLSEEALFVDSLLSPKLVVARALMELYPLKPKSRFFSG